MIPGRSGTLLKSNEFIAGRLGSIVRLNVNMQGSSSGGNIKERLCEDQIRACDARMDPAKRRLCTHTHTPREATAALRRTAKAFDSFGSVFSVHFYWAPTRTTAQTDVWKYEKEKKTGLCFFYPSLEQKKNGVSKL